jgi:ABC-type transport system involved in cytochrome c biogenesis permease component
MFPTIDTGPYVLCILCKLFCHRFIMCYRVIVVVSVFEILKDMPANINQTFCCCSNVKLLLGNLAINCVRANECQAHWNLI